MLLLSESERGRFFTSGQIMSSNSYILLLDVIFTFMRMNFTISFLQMKKIFFTITKFDFNLNT